MPEHLHALWTLPADDADLAYHLDYIHFNPVKHGLVERVQDWPWSSFHRFARQGLLPEDWLRHNGVAKICVHRTTT